MPHREEAVGLKHGGDGIFSAGFTRFNADLLTKRRPKDVC